MKQSYAILSLLLLFSDANAIHESAASLGATDENKKRLFKTLCLLSKKLLLFISPNRVAEEFTKRIRSMK